VKYKARRSRIEKLTRDVSGPRTVPCTEPVAVRRACYRDKPHCVYSVYGMSTTTCRHTKGELGIFEGVLNLTK
jgi:hypothetical protein